MKTAIVTSFSALVLALIFVTPAQAQYWKLTADIPFNFNVGNVEMTSGKYQVEIYGNGMLVVRSAENQKSVISFSSAMVTPRDLKKGRLIFNAYGAHYFLSLASWPAGPSRVLRPAKVELLAEKTLEEKRRLAVASE